MFGGNITPSLESPFFKDLNDACCISGGQMQPAKIKFKSTISSVMQQTLHTQRENTEKYVHLKMPFINEDLKRRGLSID